MTTSFNQFEVPLFFSEHGLSCWPHCLVLSPHFPNWVPGTLRKQAWQGSDFYFQIHDGLSGWLVDGSMSISLSRTQVENQKALIPFCFVCTCVRVHVEAYGDWKLVLSVFLYPFPPSIGGHGLFLNQGLPISSGFTGHWGHRICLSPHLPPPQHWSHWCMINVMACFTGVLGIWTHAFVLLQWVFHALSHLPIPQVKPFLNTRFRISTWDIFTWHQTTRYISFNSGNRVRFVFTWMFLMV